ncbi:MAG: DUF4493 domain-containing protein [Bacteroidales bacterium]|nr:DUF4493 domain-containing protein [Bacteroidales bacterium]
MKKMKSLAMAIWVVGVALVTLQGCSQFNLEDEVGNGTISLAIKGIDAIMHSDDTFLKSGTDLDTNNFILTVTSSSGTVVYDGPYGSKPEEIEVLAGDYNVSVSSIRFSPPMFDAPQFGDTQTVTVGKGENVRVRFNCKQVNAGLRLKFSDDFIAKFPGNGVFIQQRDNRVAYDYSQTKYLYLDESVFSMVYNGNKGDTVLLNKALVGGQMVTMSLSYKNTFAASTTFGVQIDTTRDWIKFDFNVALNIPDGVLSIPEAVLKVGEKVQVFGYILGGDPSTSSIRIGPPFESQSSIVIATSMTERSRNRMMVVELPTGDIRNALNLVNNPHLLGNPIIITGTVSESYYGHPGIKSTKSYTMM